MKITARKSDYKPPVRSPGHAALIRDLALTTNQKRTPWDDQWHDVRVVRNTETGSIKVYFDDMTMPQMEVLDRTYNIGRVGIGSFDDLNESDDVVVRKL